MPDNMKETANNFAPKTAKPTKPKDSHGAKQDNNGTETGVTATVSRIQQTERCDDALACLAMLSNKTLEQVTALAYDAGFPRRGPAYIPDEMLVTLAMKSGGWVAKIYKEFTSYSQLPSVAILYVDYSEVVDLGRTVLWLRPPTSENFQINKAPEHSKINSESTLNPRLELPAQCPKALDLGNGYIIDPAYWITPDQQVITGITPVHFEPMWYMELHLMSNKSGKTEKAG